MVKPKVPAAAVALPLMFLLSLALHRYLVQARLAGHAGAEIQHLPLPCWVLPLLAFVYLARWSARLVHSPHLMQGYLGQHSGCHSVHWERCLMRQHLHQVPGC